MVQDKVKEFFGQFPITEHQKGDIVIFAHMSLSSICYVESGSVIEYDIDGKGTRNVLNTFKPKAFFPMSNAVNHADTPYFFEADSSVKIRKAPANMVVKFVKENPDVLYDLLQRTYRGTDGLLSRMAEMMHGDAESRVMRELNILMKRFGSDTVERGERLTQKITENELAERTGLARETVSRSLGKLKTKGSLSSDKGYLVIAG